MNERQPGEDLGIGWGVAEDPQTDAMDVSDARDLKVTEDADADDEPGRSEGAAEGDDEADRG